MKKVNNMNIQDFNINCIKPISITEHDHYIGYTLPFLDLIGFKRKKNRRN